MELNERTKIGSSFILLAIHFDNTEIFKLLIDRHNIILNINDKNNDGWSPICSVSGHNNIRIVKLLIDYANRHNITLKINDKSKMIILQ